MHPDEKQRKRNRIFENEQKSALPPGFVLIPESGEFLMHPDEKQRKQIFQKTNKSLRVRGPFWDPKAQTFLCILMKNKGNAIRILEN